MASTIIQSEVHPDPTRQTDAPERSVAAERTGAPQLNDAPEPTGAAELPDALDPAQEPLRLRLSPPDAEGEPASEAVARVVEALLFASDAPLSAARLAEYAGQGVTQRQVRDSVAALNERYAAAGLTFRIEAIARGYQMLSLAEFRPYIQRMNHKSAQTRLSNAALETLSIIAYKQPIIRADIEAIRGVALGDTVNRLRELGLVRIVGRAEVVGRPQLFGTTRKFLDVFGLSDLKDLPEIEALGVKPPASPPPAPPEASTPVTRPAEEVAPGAAAEPPRRRAVAGA